MERTNFIDRFLDSALLTALYQHSHSAEDRYLKLVFTLFLLPGILLLFFCIDDVMAGALLESGLEFGTALVLAGIVYSWKTPTTASTSSRMNGFVQGRRVINHGVCSPDCVRVRWPAGAASISWRLPTSPLPGGSQYAMELMTTAQQLRRLIKSGKILPSLGCKPVKQPTDRTCKSFPIILPKRGLTFSIRNRVERLTSASIPYLDVKTDVVKIIL